MSISQTNTNQYTAVYKDFVAKGKTFAEALMNCLWMAKDAGVKLNIN